MNKFSDIKKDFPIFERDINGKKLTYLDSGATSQKPNSVIDKMNDIYKFNNANVHRGTYVLSSETTSEYESVRYKLQSFLNASESDEIIFTKGTTEALNFLANSIANKLMGEGDEIILSEIEHHANIIPWQMVAEKYKLNINYVKVNDDFSLDLDDLSSKLSSKTKVVSIVGESNLSGMLPDIKEINNLVRSNSDALLIIDGAQLVPHRKVDVQDLGIDFLVFSGHKMLGPTGIGVVWGRKELLNSLDPVYGGGDMIEEVHYDKATWAPVPHKFEAGTPNIAGGIALKTAIDWVTQIGLDNIISYEKELIDYATNELSKIQDIRFIGQAKEKAGVISFLVGNVHPYDVGVILDKLGIAVRTGHHCAQPVMDQFSIPGTIRASFAVYNSTEDVNRLVEGVKKAQKMLS